MFEIASQIFICLLLAAVIGGVIGYLLGKLSCQKSGGNGSHIIEKDRECQEQVEKSTDNESTNRVDEDSDIERDRKSFIESIREDESLKTAVSNPKDKDLDDKRDENGDKDGETDEKSDSQAPALDPVPAPVPAPAPTSTSNSNSNSNSVATDKIKDENKKDRDTEERKGENVEEDKQKTAPKGIDKPRDGKKNDLKRIKGIGPKIEERLNSLGIFHYDQIASWTKKEVNWVNSFLHFSGRIEREDWIGQAKILAEGGETEFAKRVDAGRVPSSKK
jgi:predicted flap endonuclease-1-like 5' DNA nuclease